MSHKKITEDTDVITYHCSQCQMTTKYKNSLKRHIYDVHGEKITCRLCNNQFTEVKFPTHMCRRSYSEHHNAETQTSPSRGQTNSHNDAGIQTDEPDMDILSILNGSNETDTVTDIDVDRIVQLIDIY